MSYILKQKLNIKDFVGFQSPVHKIVLHEPEEYLSALYAHYLREHNFEVKNCSSLDQLRDSVEDFAPKILIFSVESPTNLNFKANWLLNFKNNFPQITIITTGFNTSSDILKLLLQAGISSHMNRKLTRPQDLAIIAKHLLQTN